MVRALYSSYNGSLYQVQRSSDGATKNIGLLSAAAATPTPPPRTPSAPARPASSPGSTTSPPATTTSRSRARAGPAMPMSGRPRTRCR
ncbi:arabinofuranosidase catalytic domain-containing protein [Streptomyces lasalocidi]